MQANFKNELGQVYTLGTVSLNWIDSKDVFDPFQEDSDYNSDIIFKASGAEKLNLLAGEIEHNLNISSLPREDIKIKIAGFCAFLKRSDSVVLTIN
ncbi:MAG: hypothetical protein ACTHMC_09830 [Pseudobacter sp.]|uniref:hypothetical protein n=1 Tax=Pseudobacter sp. TaxID=2045420 RepID=UPI003F7E655B